jgi:hypothetical protein
MHSCGLLGEKCKTAKPAGMELACRRLTARPVAEDCVIENTVPAPNGSRRVGRDACVALWREIATTPGTRFDLEDVVVAGDRAIIRWRFWWGEGEASSVRGVNLMRVRDGRIVEAMGYVKAPAAA